MEKQSPFEEFRNIETYSDQEILGKIWLSPRKIFRYVHYNDYDKFVAPLLMLTGIIGCFGFAKIINAGAVSNLFVILTSSVIFGGLFGWILYYFYAYFVSQLGKEFGGKANTTTILRIIAYAKIPSVFAMIFFIAKITLFGTETFKSEPDFSVWGEWAVFIDRTSSLSEIILTIWTYILSILGLAEIQKYSIVSAMFNLLFPFVLVFLILLTFYFIFIN